MRTSNLAALLLPTLAACHVFHVVPQPADAVVAVTVTTPSATAASVPRLRTPTPTSTSTVALHGLELRQAPGLAPVGNNPPNPNIAVPPVNPAVPPANPVAPLANPAVPPANPAAPPVVVAPTPPPAPSESVVVQWVETWLDGTSTWVPKTITIKYDTAKSRAPEPGKGVIGMGTLTGEIGKTKTVVMGAAQTVGGCWYRGAVVAAGVGFVGLIV